MPFTNFSSANQSLKRSNIYTNNASDASPVPLPIQTFLWRQSNPFLGSKVKKLHEASAVTFERVVVQNILHGLSPSLSDAIISIPRWQFVKTSFPHIVQCCGSILGERPIDEIGSGNLSSSLVKLLYILHWLLMDSSNECNEDTEISENKDGEECIEFKNYVFSISNVQHFVYMIVPMLQQIKENELASHFRLESGIKIWKALWSHQIPDVLCFYAPVKQKYSPLPLITLLTKKTSVESVSNCGMGIYLGDEVSKNDIGSNARRFSHTVSTVIGIPPPKPPRTNETNLEDLVSGPPLKPNIVTSSEGSKKPTNITFDESIKQSSSPHQSTPDSPDFSGEFRSPLPEFLDISAANYLDVAVIRCLLIQHWSEDGVLWSLHYLYNRVRDIQFEKSHNDTFARSRSNSVPGRRKDTKCSLNGFMNFTNTCDPYINTNLPQLTFADLHKSSELLDRRLSTRLSIKRKISSDRRSKESDNLQFEDNLPKVNVKDSSTTLELPPKSDIRKMSLNIADHLKVRRLSKSSVTLSQLPSQVFDNTTLTTKNDDKSPEINTNKPFLPSISTKYFTEAVGSSSFISPDGKLSFTVILKTILNIIDRYQNIKICEIVLSIADVILSLTTMGSLGECKITITYPLIIEILSKIYIFMGCSAGCNEGMRTAHACFLKVKAKNLIAQMIRYDEKYFKKVVGEEFENKSYHQVLDFIHSITSFCGERIGGKRRGTGIGTRMSFNNSFSYKTKNNITKKLEDRKESGYKNSFNEAMNGIEGIIIDIFFSSLVLKLNEKARELLLPENMSVYHDVRMFVNYVNENHGNPLRKTALSALIEKLKNPRKKDDDYSKKTSIIDDKKSFFNGDNRKKSNTASVGTITSVNKIYNKIDKYSTDNNPPALHHNHLMNHSIKSASHQKNHRQSHLPKHSASLDQFNDNDSNGDVIGCDGNVPKQYNTNLEQQSETLGVEEGISSIISQNSPHLQGSFYNSKRKQQNISGGTSLCGNDNAVGKVSASKFQFAISLLKGSSANNSNTNLKQDYSEEDIISLASSKNGIELLTNFSTENIINLDDENFSHSSPAVISINSKADTYNNNLAFQKAAIHALISDKKMIHLKNLREGIRRFNFLLEMSNPGNVLDAPLIGALIDLKSPVISRACILLECSFYINRCNKGDWAEWIKSNISISTGTFTRGVGSSNSSKTNQTHGFQSSGWYNAIGINTSNYGSQIGGTYKSGTNYGPNIGVVGRNKKLHTMQRMAGRNFYRWGLCLAGKLKNLLDKEDENEKNCLNDDASLPDKRTMKLREELECFLDDATINCTSGEGTPKALQLLACFLLLQITTYLRESFQILPKVSKGIHTRNSGNQYTLQNPTQVGSISTGDSKYNSQRRWSILSNTFIQHGGSIHSINEPSIPQVGIIGNVLSERRVSYSTVDDDSSTRGSHDTIDDLGIANNPSDTNRKSGSSKAPRITQGRTRLFKKTSPIRKGSSSEGIAINNMKSSHKREFSFKFRRPSKQQADIQANVSPTAGQEDISEERENVEVGDNENSTGSTIHSHLQHSPLVTQNDIGDKSPERRNTTTSTKKASLLNQSTTHQNLNSVPSAPLSSTMLEEDEELTKKIPWIPIVLRILNSFDFNCTHELNCKRNCFLKCYRQCHKLLEAYKIIHGKDDENLINNETLDMESLIFLPTFDKREKIIESFENYKRGNNIHNKNQNTFSSTRRESALVRALNSNPPNCNGIFDEDKKVPLALRGLMDKLGETDENIFNNGTKQGSDKGLDAKEILEFDKVEEKELNKLHDVLSPINVFLNTQIKNIMHVPISFFLKSAVILKNEDFSGCVKTCWNLLTFNDTNISSSAAALFILCAVKVPTEVTDVMLNDLNSNDTELRVSAIQKFYVLWRNRFHVWQKMEDGAQAMFKVPPPSIDFTLPSPMIGQSHAPVIDPPWMPYVKTRVEELSIKEEQHSTSQTIMTMTRTRRKQKQEMVKKAIREAEEKQSELRQKFMIRSTALIQQSAYEPSLFQHTVQSLPQSQPSGNIPAGGSNTEFDLQEIDQQVNVNPIPQTSYNSQKQMPMAVITQPLLPSSILASVPTIVELYSDVKVSKTGISVCSVAKQVTWSCIIEEPSLFFRHFLEKLTNKDKQEYIISLLRKLLFAFKYIPSQTAYCLLNYLFGFVMFYVRAPTDGSDKILSLALSTIWLITPFVHGLYFKDLKQTLKKEQCDQALMITANVPSAKKIIVHGPDQSSGGIPSQFPIHEDTQFHQILVDSIEFFNIPQEESYMYYLVDAKTGMVHISTNFVRDFYFFHRSFYPQLYLVKLNPYEAMKKQKLNTLYQKQIESGKVLLTHNALIHSPENVIPQRIFFLHDEFTHLLSFPRKAIESSFSMYFGEYGDELKAVDSMHKLTWVNLITSIFEKMENAFMFGDLHLFINVINGVMIVHCEDILILRRCLATYLTVAIHFNQHFASQGFFLIIPTILRCYSQRQTNRMFCESIEFLCKQFYILHRKPFLLQMFGAIANLIDMNANMLDVNPVKIKGKYLFNLIKSMESLAIVNDTLDILSLVPYPKPLKPLDLCYKEDPNAFNLLTDAMASCVTVCCYAPESKRSYQMILVMQACLQHYFDSLEKDTSKNNNNISCVKMEVNCFNTICVEMKALVNGCDVLARGPNRTFDSVLIGSGVGDMKSRNFAMAESPMFFDPPTMAEEETVIYGNNSNGGGKMNSKEKCRHQISSSNWDGSNNENNSEIQREMYRKPRDALLTLCASYIEKGSVRLKELSKLNNTTSEHFKLPELFDHKCHIKLAEVAISLLKLASSDLITMSSVGLQKYFTVILPVTDWSIEANRSVLTILLRRFDKTISKIGKKSSLRRRANWNALSGWLAGLHQTLAVYPYIAHLHPVKTISQMCLRIIVGDNCQDDGGTSSATGGNPSQGTTFANTTNFSNAQGNLNNVLGFNTILSPYVPNTTFSNTVIKLVLFLMQALGQVVYSIETICSPESVGYASTERIEALLCYLMIPMFFKSAYPTKDAPAMASKDLGYCLQLMYSAVLPSNNKQTLQSNITPAISLSSTTGARINNANLGGITSDLTGRQGSVSVTEKGHSATVSTLFAVRESVVQSVFFALKVMILSFQKQMTLHWPKVIKIVKELISQKYVGTSLLSFTDFLIQANLPISIIVLPMIETKLKQRTNSGTCGSESDLYAYNEVKRKMTMRDRLTILEKSSRTMLEELNTELVNMKEEFQMRSFELVTRRETPTKASGVCEGASDSGSVASLISSMPRNSGAGIGIKNVLRESTRRHSSITGKRGSFMHKNFNKGHDSDTVMGHSNSQVDAIYEDNEDETPLMSNVQRSRQSSIGALGIWRSIRHKKKVDTGSSEFLSGLEDNNIEMMEMQKRIGVVPFSRKAASLKAKIVSTGVVNKGTRLNDDLEKGFMNGSPSKSKTFCGTYDNDKSSEKNVEIKNHKTDKSKIVQFSSNRPVNYEIEEDEDSDYSITVTHHLI
uniref:UNC80 domain-containing protein n=1 Tax=Parastrongyloides trichosuri TaxID=131310 RepID=A0A0N4ZFZ3_PARTI